MSEACFLPEDDQEFLKSKGLKFSLLRETIGAEERRGIEFSEFTVPSNLFRRENGMLVPGAIVSLLVLIPKGYSRVRLDSWYIAPAVFLANGEAAINAGSESELFGRRWQFWSRHLGDNEWRDGVDGLRTYLQYVHAGLRQP
jgi:hypothetical protein